MLLNLLFLTLGFLLLILGAGWLIDGASSLARKYRISDLAIGLTIVAFGTSAPELVVNVFAAFQGHPDIVFGNIIGSNNFNIFFILGISGLILPITVQSSTVWKEIPLSFVAMLVLFVLANDFFPGEESILSRLDGVILLGLFVLFLFYVYRQLKYDSLLKAVDSKELSLARTWVYIFVGLAGLVLGGRLVVNSAINLATQMGVSEKIIGLTIVAAGTSLPELATSVMAVLKRNNDIAVGNIIGSNIFNIFFILGLSALIAPIAYEKVFNRDIYLLAFGTAVLFIAMFTGKRKKLDRREAALLLTIYTGYTIALIVKGT